MYLNPKRLRHFSTCEIGLGMITIFWSINRLELISINQLDIPNRGWLNRFHFAPPGEAANAVRRYRRRWTWPSSAANTCRTPAPPRSPLPTWVVCAACPLPPAFWQPRFSLPYFDNGRRVPRQARLFPLKALPDACRSVTFRANAAHMSSCAGTSRGYGTQGLKPGRPSCFLRTAIRPTVQRPESTRHRRHRLHHRHRLLRTMRSPRGLTSNRRKSLPGE